MFEIDVDSSHSTEGSLEGVELNFNNISYSSQSRIHGYHYDSSLTLLAHWEVLQYLISKNYAVPLFFGPDHWANGKTAIELGIAINKTL